MISEAKSVENDVLRVVVSGVRVSHSPGQFVMVQSPALDLLLGGPMHLTITSPMQKNADRFTLHILLDEQTKCIERDWKAVFSNANISVPYGYCDPIFHDILLLVLAETAPGDFSTVLPLVPLLKTYLGVRDHGLAQELFAYLIVQHPAMYRWFIASFEGEYLSKVLPPNVHVTVCLNGLTKERLCMGSPLEESFRWSDSIWPTFQETPTPTAERRVRLAFLGCPFAWQRALRSLKRLGPGRLPQHYRLCLDAFGFRAPPQFLTRIPDPLPRAPWRWWPPDWLFRQTDPCNLGLLRMAFGASILVTQAWAVQSGAFAADHLDTAVRLPYDHLGWVPGLGPAGRCAVAGLVALSALGVCLGFSYRLSCVLLFLSYTWQWLQDSSLYHDHHYLTSLLALCFLATDAHHFGAITGHTAGAKPIPYWHVFLFKFVVSATYFFAGFWKLGLDWKLGADWVRGYPMYYWLTPEMDDTVKYAIALLLSWLMAFFELTAPLWLCFATTRPAALFVCQLYHAACTAYLYPTPCPAVLHIIPFIFLETHTVRHAALSALTSFGARLDPRRWAFRLVRWLHRRVYFYVDEPLLARLLLDVARQEAEKGEAEEGEAGDVQEQGMVPREGDEARDGQPSGLRRRKKPTGTPEANGLPNPAQATSSGAASAAPAPPKPPRKKPIQAALPASAQPGWSRRLRIVLGLLVFIVAFTAVTLRSLHSERVTARLNTDMPGTLGTSWTENGHRFSWRGLLMLKRCAGTLTVKTGPPYTVVELRDPCDTAVHPFRLTRKQCTGVLHTPSMIRSHARLLRDHYRQLWERHDVLVYTDLRCTLNGGKVQQYTFRRMDVGSLDGPSLLNWTRPERFIGPQQYFAGGRSFDK
eukprot:EG_transcript_1629